MMATLYQPFLLLAVILTCATGQPASPTTTTNTSSIEDCPKSLPRDRYLKFYDNKCYAFHVNTTADYDSAQSTCTKDGGNLAMIKSAGENKFIQASLQELLSLSPSAPSTPTGPGSPKRDNLAWIGLKFDSFLGHVEYVDGSASGILVYINYENFSEHPGYFGNKNCAAMNPWDGKWVVENCSRWLKWFEESQHFVCQYDNNVGR